MVKDRQSGRLRTTRSGSCRHDDDSGEMVRVASNQNTDKDYLNETCSCNVFAECEHHLAAINTCTDLQQTINDEIKRQAKFDRVVSHKMVAKSRRLQLRADYLQRTEDYSWLVNGLKDLSRRMRDEAEEHSFYMTTLTNHHYSIQHAIDGHQNLMSRVQSGGDIWVDRTTHSDTCEDKFTSGNHDKHDIKFLSFREACTKFDQIRKHRMSIINKLEYITAQDKTTEEQLRETRSTLSVLKNSDQDSRHWALQLKIKDQESRARFLLSHKEQLADNLQAAEKELHEFDQDSRVTLLVLLNVFTQHHQSHEECLQRGFQLLKAVSLRDKYALGSLGQHQEQRKKENANGDFECPDDKTSSWIAVATSHINQNRSVCDFCTNNPVTGASLTTSTEQESFPFDHETDRATSRSETKKDFETYCAYSSQDAAIENSSLTRVTRELLTGTNAPHETFHDLSKFQENRGQDQVKGDEAGSDVVCGSSMCDAENDNSSLYKTKRHTFEANLACKPEARKPVSPSLSGYAQTDSSSQIHSSISTDTFTMFESQKKTDVPCPDDDSSWHSKRDNNCFESGDGPKVLKKVSITSDTHDPVAPDNMSDTDSVKTRRFISKYVDNTKACQGVLSTSIQSSLTKREQLSRYQCGKWEDRNSDAQKSDMKLNKNVSYAKQDDDLMTTQNGKVLNSQPDFSNLSNNYNSSEIDTSDNVNTYVHGDMLDFEHSSRSRKQCQGRNIKVCTVKPIYAGESSGESETETKTNIGNPQMNIASSITSSKLVCLKKTPKDTKPTKSGHFIAPRINDKSPIYRDVQNDSTNFVKRRSILLENTMNFSGNRMDSADMKMEQGVNRATNKGSQTNENVIANHKATKTKKVRFCDSVELDNSPKRPVSRHMVPTPAEQTITCDSNSNQSNNTGAVSDDRIIYNTCAQNAYGINIHKTLQPHGVQRMDVSRYFNEQELFNSNIIALFSNEKCVKLIFHLDLKL